MTYSVETYTTNNGSNMDEIAYNDIPMEDIAADLIRNYDNWDYAIVSDEDGDVIATITSEGDIETESLDNATVSGKVVSDPVPTISGNREFFVFTVQVEGESPFEGRSVGFYPCVVFSDSDAYSIDVKKGDHVIVRGKLADKFWSGMDARGYSVEIIVNEIIIKQAKEPINEIEIEGKIVGDIRDESYSDDCYVFHISNDNIHSDGHRVIVSDINCMVPAKMLDQKPEKGDRIALRGSLITLGFGDNSVYRIDQNRIFASEVL